MARRPVSRSEIDALRKFCEGRAPSSIDREMHKPEGWTRNAVTAWWLADKAVRGGMSLKVYAKRTV